MLNGLSTDQVSTKLSRNRRAHPLTGMGGAIRVKPFNGSRKETAAAIRSRTPALPNATQWVPKCSKPQPPSQELIMAPIWCPR
jgi:hypothetical protein